MPNYDKPPMNTIPFEFTTGGYTKPDFSEVPFQWGLRPIFQQTANLQAAITVVSQSSADLLASIQGVTRQRDLGAYIKSTIQATKNLGASAYGIPPVDLPAYVKSTIQAYKNLGASAYGIPPVDLAASLISILFKGSADLSAILETIPPEDLPANIFGIAPIDLPAIIIATHIKELAAYMNIIEISNLPATLKALSQEYKNLGALIDIISVYNLPSTIHGFDTRDLTTILTGVYGPYDIQAAITGGGGYKGLFTYIKGMIGTEIPVDLPAAMEGWYTSDLSAYTKAILAADLTAYINATGKSVNLPATIIPKVIYLSTAIQVALLEHKDLKAIVNTPCFGSGHLNLLAYIRSIEKLDLKAYIIGWRVDLTADGIVDLAAYINTAEYNVEDKLEIKFVPEANQYTQLKIDFDATGPAYTVFDTLEIIYGTKYNANLSATINGILESIDLSASVTAIYDWNYTELPPSVSPKTHEVVIDFNSNWKEQWRKFVEIFFDFTGTTPYHYFYVSGADKVYRVDRNRHWTIWIKSYDETDSAIERRNMRHKYIFRVSQYSTIDEAIRDMIDRISDYRRFNLGASITGILGPHSDLTASVIPDVKYSWIKYLNASATGRLRFYIDTETLDLSASITGL